MTTESPEPSLTPIETPLKDSAAENLPQAPEEGECEEPEPKKLNPLWELAQAIAEVAQVTFEANKGPILREARMLRKPDVGATAEDVREHFATYWFERDWRGKKGQPPSIMQVRQNWGRWENGNGACSDPAKAHATDPDEVARINAQNNPVVRRKRAGTRA